MVVDVDSAAWDKEVLQSSVPVIVDFWAPLVSLV
jgi:thioredoxin-like negative regulator of GroEL